MRCTSVLEQITRVRQKLEGDLGGWCLLSRRSEDGEKPLFVRIGVDVIQTIRIENARAGETSSCCERKSGSRSAKARGT
jgi:hypothetical protein